MMKSTITLILAAALCAASVSAQTAYKIDIGVDTTTNLKAGYSGLTGTNGSTATIDGRLFTLNVSAGTQGARNRGTSGAPPGIDALTADFGFVQADAGNVEMTLNLGAAGALRAGTWQMSVYSADWNVGLAAVVDQRIGITTTTGSTTSEVTYGAAVDQKFDGPAITFTFTSDGVSAYTLFLRDSLANPTAGTDPEDVIRFNGIDLVFIPDRLSAKIDIGLDTTTNLKAGYTGLTGTNGSTATIDSRLFTLNVSGTSQGARNRGVNPGIGIDELTADFGFVQADAGNVEMTLNLGAAGALQAGTWQMSVYSADWNVGLAAVVDQRIGITTTTGITTSEVTYGAAVDQKFDGPAITFTFTSDGVSAYTLFLRDSLANPTAGTDPEDAIRFNGIDLVFVPQLSGFTYNRGDGSSQVSITGSTGVRYRLVEADDLDFANPDQDPIPLTGATVGTLDGNVIIADASGNATVQFNLGTAKPATFLRAQTVP